MLVVGLHRNSRLTNHPNAFVRYGPFPAPTRNSPSKQARGRVFEFGGEVDKLAACTSRLHSSSTYQGARGTMLVPIAIALRRYSRALVAFIPRTIYTGRCSNGMEGGPVAVPPPVLLLDRSFHQYHLRPPTAYTPHRVPATAKTRTTACPTRTRRHSVLVRTQGATVECTDLARARAAFTSLRCVRWQPESRRTHGSPNNGFILPVASSYNPRRHKLEIENRNWKASERARGEGVFEFGTCTPSAHVSPSLRGSSTGARRKIHAGAADTGAGATKLGSRCIDTPAAPDGALACIVRTWAWLCTSTGTKWREEVPLPRLCSCSSSLFPSTKTTTHTSFHRIAVTPSSYHCQNAQDRLSHSHTHEDGRSLAVVHLAAHTALAVPQVPHAALALDVAADEDEGLEHRAGGGMPHYGRRGMYGARRLSGADLQGWEHRAGKGSKAGWGDC
ncbi:hypothetical protein B0H16DRAFT_1904545 [Mycena metata]|uniref:Uncharacterized protein n=1 Tax=Mycena metata TaxID=1033252 RepID=A0AAD7DKA4_9AGAR|nr:hypothetical protein B0H16DRAFT_1904545 [Mycena metata]